MSQLHVTGPAQIFVGTGVSQAWEFLGYTEQGVEINLRSPGFPVYSDVSGPTIPLDEQFMGEEAEFLIRLTVYNEPVFQRYAARGPTFIGGQGQPNQVGTLRITEGYYFPMLIYGPYSVKTVFSTMTQGYAFYATWPDDVISVPFSVRTKIPQIAVRARPIFNIDALTYLTYTNTLPSPLPIPA